VPEGLQIVDVFPQEFMLDGKIDVNPVGTMPELVEAHYKIAVCQPFIFKNLDACFESLGIAFEPVLGPLATAEAVLKSEEMAKGVVVINFGAQTTSVCVYKGNIVRYISILPFGGDNITKDLEYLNIEEGEAEKYKIESGSAVHLEDVADDEEEVNELDKLSTFDKEANEIIVARAEEIVENIYAQIRYAGIEPQKLTEGIIMTGGTSDLSGLSELLSKKTGMAVRKASPGQQLVNLTGIDMNQEDALCLGLLMLGKADCCIEWKQKPEPEKIVQEPVIEGFEPEAKKEVVKTKNPPKPKEKRKNPIGGFWNKLFDDEDI
ncbi:MAG: cell division FtsA domain-containing protein, partial [Bacteroidota bacterium]|nr:cell division FtsA domain-containing protein [Bacteroidota bacterium]